MIVEVIALLVAVVAAFIVALVVRGLLPVALRPDGSAVYHLSIGVILLLFSIAMRALYWDGLPVMFALIHPDLWTLWVDRFGRPIPNVIIGLMVLAGARHLLILQWLLIPEEDRASYSIFTAPFYPQRVCIVRGVEALKKVWRRER
ncbi:hypothetical protein PAF17_16105 [Paracoccus sp. Z330]|uniref:Uncharacterized protein n=1 Tax=Paracoccus onchidii TaxID=3017813 RepID=A0ABT4ZI81_9RHOB|nr:hypothetical protein [Paracoccus onchidii]MDB6179016.1 hypothetical protein [Paracoccus onchidii]